MPALLYTCTSAAKFKETRLKLRERRKTCWSDQQIDPVKTSNSVTMVDNILIQSTLFSLIPPLMTVQCHCLGFLNRVTWPHCPSARLQHQPNIILSVSPQNPPQKILSGQHISKSVWDFMASVTTSLVSFIFPLLPFMDFFWKLIRWRLCCYMSLISWPWTREEALYRPLVWGIEDLLYGLQRRLLFQCGITPTGLGHDYRTLHCGLKELLYSFLSHLVKCDSVLVAEPELPVASLFLGKVMERFKVTSSGMLKKSSGGLMGVWIKGFSHDFKKPCFRISLCCVI